MLINTSHKSPNHSSRNGAAIRALVVHATAGSFSSALGWLCNPASRVSAHFLISKSGDIYQLVPEELSAWHAGVSQWHGLEVWQTAKDGSKHPTLNPVSIGIELENLNTGRDAYPQAQTEALVALSRQIVARYRLDPSNVVRHLDIAPGRKTDPAGLPWPAFQAALGGGR